MHIEVELFATLARFLPADAGGRTVVDVPDGATVADVAWRLGVPAGFERVALVNGHEADEERVLTPGDVLTFFPPLAGGMKPSAR